MNSGRLIARDPDLVPKPHQLLKSRPNICVEVLLVDGAQTAGLGSPQSLRVRLKPWPKDLEHLAVILSSRNHSTNIAENVCRGTPSQSAQAPHSDVSSISVSPTSN